MSHTESTNINIFHNSKFIISTRRYKRQKLGGVAASPWAIKKAKKGHARKNIFDRLAEEAKILRSLQHVNIVLFKKFTKTPKGLLLFVYNIFLPQIKIMSFLRFKNTVRSRFLEFLENSNKGNLENWNFLKVPRIAVQVITNSALRLKSKSPRSISSRTGDVCLSMEAFGKGLDDIIFRHRENEEIFTAQQVTQVTYSISNALDYLHNTKKLLHGDMKSGNILVSVRFQGFGL